MCYRDWTATLARVSSGSVCQVTEPQVRKLGVFNEEKRGTQRGAGGRDEDEGTGAAGPGGASWWGAEE